MHNNSNHITIYTAINIHDSCLNLNANKTNTRSKCFSRAKEEYSPSTHATLGLPSKPSAQ